MIVRTAVGRALAVLLAFAMSQLAAPVAYAVDAVPAPAHLVASAQVQGRLADAAAARADQVRAVQSVLDTAEARRQAGVLGVDAGRLRSAVPHLSDVELADLSARAAQVKDVAAGHHTNDEGLIILGVVLLVAGLVLLATMDGYGYYDDCGCYY